MADARSSPIPTTSAEEFESGSEDEYSSEVETGPEVDEGPKTQTDPEGDDGPSTETGPEIETETDPEIETEIGPKVKTETSPEVETCRPELEINNVCCRFSLRCKLDLFDIAERAISIEYNEGSVLQMRNFGSNTEASIYKSGKVVCKGAKSEEEAHTASRQYARKLQKLGYDVKFCEFRIFNVWGTCHLPFDINIPLFAQANPQSGSYEPELGSGVTYRVENLKVTLKIYSTGSITVVAPNVDSAQAALDKVYPLIVPFLKPKKVKETKRGRKKKKEPAIKEEIKQEIDP